MEEIMLEFTEWNSVEEAAEYFKSQEIDSIGLVNKFEMHSLIALEKKLGMSPEELSDAIDALLIHKQPDSQEKQNEITHA